MTETALTVFEAFSAVMADVQSIAKGDRNIKQNFSFRGIDAVMNTVGPSLREHGVVIIPDALEIATERYQSNQGGGMKNATVRMRYTVYGPAGDSFTGSSYGEAADSGDKAVSKAQSVAYRTFLLQGLTVPTQERDPDQDAHERTPQTPADDARSSLLETLRFKGIDPAAATEKFFADGNGELRESNDVDAIQALTSYFRAVK